MESIVVLLASCTAQWLNERLLDFFVFLLVVDDGVDYAEVTAR